MKTNVGLETRSTIHYENLFIFSRKRRKLCFYWKYVYKYSQNHKQTTLHLETMVKGRLFFVALVIVTVLYNYICLTKQIKRFYYIFITLLLSYNWH